MSPSPNVLKMGKTECTAVLEGAGFTVTVEPGDLRGEEIPLQPKRWRAKALGTKDDTKLLEVEGAPNKITALRCLTVLCMLSGHSLI